MRLVTIALSSASMFVLATAANAQSANNASSGGAATAQAQNADAGGNGVAALSEIIVHAQRRAERLQDVPITITNLNSQKLVDANVKSLADVTQLTPALRFDYQGAFAQPAIRGVSTQLAGANVGSNVGIYVDGFYVVSPLATDFQLLNVSDVEVLKGPQGTLFGRNTNGGAILVTTSKPSHDARAVIDGQYGSYNARQVSLYGTHGLGDRVAVDFSGIYAGGDGYTKDTISGSNKVGAYTNWTVRAGASIELTSNLNMVFHYTHADVNDPTYNLTNTYVIDGAPQSLVSGPRGPFLPLAGPITSKPNTVSLGVPATNLVKSDAFQLTTSADLHFATLTSYSQFVKEDDDAVASLDQLALSVPSVPGLGLFDPVADHSVSHQALVTQEFLLASKPGGPLQWTTGFFLFDQKQRLSTVVGGPPFNGSASKTDYVSYAVYGDVTYKLLDQLYLTGGLRYTHDVGQHLSVNGIRAPDFSSDAVTPRAVIRYHLTNRSNVYFSYSQGFKAAVVDLTTSRPVKPERLSAYEVGYKYAGGPLRFDLAAYYYDWKDIQVQYVTSGLTQLTVNASGAKIYGVESQVSYDITSDLSVYAGTNYTHAEYDDFPNSAFFGPSYPSAGGAVINAKGFTLPRSPQFTTSLGARYSHDLAGGQFALSGNLYHTTKIFFDSSNQTMQGAYATLALRAEWTDPSKRYTLAVFGNNVTNTRYLTGVLETQSGIGQSWSAPATVGASVRVNLH